MKPLIISFIHNNFSREKQIVSTKVTIIYHKMAGRLPNN